MTSMPEIQSGRGVVGGATDYLHGFTRTEQDRLYAQARFLAPSVMARVDLEGRRRLLEVACGVGAETELLLARFPALAITGVDASEEQLARARERLAAPIAAGRVRLARADALAIPVPDGSHDCAFLCWFLEHVGRPREILAETRRALAPGSPVHCVEVLNASLHMHPPCPATMRFWEAMNRRQAAMGGDPHAGARLGEHLLRAGWRDIETYAHTYHLDARTPTERAAFLDYWRDLLLSAAPSLTASGDADDALVSEMLRELAVVRDDPSGVFIYTWIGAIARA